MSTKPRELTADELWSRCDPAMFEFETTDSLPGEVMIIGQERAVDAIDFGVNIASFGFNVYALGHTGTGRTTTLRTFLERSAAGQPVPNDWIYVYNFVEPNQPNAIALPPGTAVELRRDMEELVADLLREIPRAFESEDYEKQQEEIVRQMQEQRNAELVLLEHKVNERGFTLIKTAMGLGIAPVLNGQVLTPEAYQELDEATREDIEARQQLAPGRDGRDDAQDPRSGKDHQAPAPGLRPRDRRLCRGPPHRGFEAKVRPPGRVARVPGGGPRRRGGATWTASRPRKKPPKTWPPPCRPASTRTC